MPISRRSPKYVEPFAPATFDGRTFSTFGLNTIVDRGRCATTSAASSRKLMLATSCAASTPPVVSAAETICAIRPRTFRSSTTLMPLDSKNAVMSYTVGTFSPANSGPSHEPASHLLTMSWSVQLETAPEQFVVRSRVESCMITIPPSDVNRRSVSNMAAPTECAYSKAAMVFSGACPPAPSAQQPRCAIMYGWASISAAIAEICAITDTTFSTRVQT
mmetsp:Transcript_41577/g.81485  ORF Transcript_41577/g.81485 Transcript_41577/m.81485 type:complete len:218 (-) Transcript_41577:202-855(-)